jgi:hypothetical protein
MAFIDQSKIFYGASSFLGLLAIIYFGFEYLVDLSPFSISAILFSVFVFFLVLGLRIGGNTSVLSYVFSSGAYVVALFYTLARFNLGSNGVQISLIISSGLFAALGYYITQKDLELSKKQFRSILLAVGVVLALLTAYDIASGELSYSYELKEEVELNETVSIGEVTVEKDSFLPYDARSINFNGCLSHSEEPMHISGFSSSTDTMVFGHLRNTEPIVIELDPSRISEGETVSIEEGTGFPRCNDEPGGERVLKVFADSEGLEIRN